MSHLERVQAWAACQPLPTALHAPSAPGPPAGLPAWPARLGPLSAPGEASFPYKGRNAHPKHMAAVDRAHDPLRTNHQ